MAAGTSPPPSAGPVPAGQAIEYDRYIENQLRRTRQQVKAVDLASALMLLAAGSLGYLMLAALADQWLVPGGLGFWGRSACLAGFIVGVVALVALRVAPLVLKRINPVYAADTIERSRPTLKNSLINFLLLRSSPQGIPQRMFQAMEEQAVAGLTSTNVDEAVDRRPLIRLLIVLLVVVASCAFYRLFSPKNPFTSMRRVIVPWADIDAPTRVRIDEIQPGDAEAYHDARLTVSAWVRGIRQGEEVTLIYSTADGQVVDHAVPMTLPESSYRYAAELPADAAGLQQDLFYRIASGDAVSPRFRIRVLTPPSIAVERVDYDYPAYTEIPPRTVERQGDIDGREGARVTIHAKASHPIRTADLDFDCNAQRDLAMKVDGRQASVSFVLALAEGGKAEHESYQLRFTNEEGHENPKPIRHTITVVGDLPPEIAFVEPQFDGEEDYAWPVGSKLPLKLTASDPDFKLAEVKLHLRRGEEKLLEKQILPEARDGPYNGSYLLDGRALALNEGDVLELWAAAADNKQPRANVTETSHFRLRVVSPQGGKNDADKQLAQNSPDNARQDSNNKPDQKQQRGERNDPAQRKSGAGQQDENQASEQQPSRTGKKQRRQRPSGGERKPSEPGQDHSPDETAPTDQPHDQRKHGEKQKDKSQQEQNDQNSQGGGEDAQQTGGTNQGAGKDQGGNDSTANQENESGESSDDKQHESPDEGSDGKLAANDKPSKGGKRSTDEKSSARGESPQDDDSRVDPQDLARAMEKIAKLMENKPDDKSGDKNKPSDGSQPAGQKPQDQGAKADPSKGEKKNAPQVDERTGQSSTPGEEKQDRSSPGPRANDKQEPGENQNASETAADEDSPQRPQPGDKQGNKTRGADKLPGDQAGAEKPQAGDDRSADEPQPSEETNPRSSDAKQGERRQAGENNERQKNRGDLQLEDRKQEDADKQPHAGQKDDGQRQEGDEKGEDEKGDASQQQDKDGQPQGGGKDGEQPGGKPQTSAKPGQESSAEKGGKTDSQNGLPNEGAQRKASEGKHQGEQAAGGDQEYKHAEGQKKPQDGQGGKTKGTGEPDEKEKPDRENKHAQQQKGGDENSLDRGDAGAGQQGGGNKNGSPDAQQENAQKEKLRVSPDSDKPDSEDQPESPSISKRHSDTEGGESGSFSGGGKKGGGQRSNSAGVGSAGQNTAADEGGGEIQQKGDGPTGTKGGDRVKGDAAQGGKPSQEKGAGSTTQPGGDKSGGADKQPPPDGVKPSGLKPDANASHPTGEPPPPNAQLPKAKGIDSNAHRAPPKGELPPDAGEGRPKSANANPADSAGNQVGGGSDNPTGGGLSGPDGTPRRQSNAPEPGGEDPNLEYSRKATDLTLDRLKDQLAKGKPDQELLDKLKWSRSDMEQFVRRWQELKRAAKAQGPKGAAAREELDETLRSLGLAPHGASLKQGGQRDDRSRELRQSRRSKPPAEYQEQYREFSKSTSKK